MHLESVDFLHNNLLVILLLSTAPRLRFMDLTGNRIGGLIMHERIEYRMLGNPVESAVLYFDQAYAGLVERTHCATIDANRGSKKCAPIIFAEDELRHLLLDKANVSGSIPRYQQSAIVGTSEATTRPNHWNFS